MENVIIYNDDVIDNLCRIALRDMKNRMDWEFPAEIEDALIDLFKDYGMDISRGLEYIFDNAYINGEWGHISDLDDNEKEEDIASFLVYDITKDIYIRNI